MVTFSLNDGLVVANFFIEFAEVMWVLLGIGAVYRIGSSTISDVFKSTLFEKLGWGK